MSTMTPATSRPPQTPPKLTGAREIPGASVNIGGVWGRCGEGAAR